MAATPMTSISIVAMESTTFVLILNLPCEA
jgi:hypothetical protein